MYTEEQLAEYMDEIRVQVCRHCIERPPGGPPCAPLGKRCGIELNLPQILDSVHATHSSKMEPYTVNFHDQVCTQCANRPTEQCPCPMEYLLILAVQAIETVDEQHEAPFFDFAGREQSVQAIETVDERHEAATPFTV